MFQLPQVLSEGSVSIRTCRPDLNSSLVQTKCNWLLIDLQALRKFCYLQPHPAKEEVSSMYKYVYVSQAKLVNVPQACEWSLSNFGIKQSMYTHVLCSKQY